MNTQVQLLALYTDRERHNTQRYRRTDVQTVRRHYDVNSRSWCVTVRAAENWWRWKIGTIYV